MEKPFPPWKYWTASSIRGTLHRVLTDLGEEAKEKVGDIVGDYTSVKEVTKIDYLIKDDFTESALVVEFALKDFKEKGPGWEEKVGKLQFSLLRGISKYLVTTSVKPHVKMITAAQDKEFTSVTKWEQIVEISKKEISFKDWKKITSFSS